MPTGRVVGVVQRNWRDYVASFAENEVNTSSIEELSEKQMTAEIQLQLNPYNSNPRFYKLAATGITSLSHQTTVNVALPSIFRTF